MQLRAKSLVERLLGAAAGLGCLATFCLLNQCLGLAPFQAFVEKRLSRSPHCAFGSGNPRPQDGSNSRGGPTFEQSCGTVCDLSAGALI